MSRLVLVRHALPELQRGVAARNWGLSESAREDCVLLAHHLGGPIGGMVHTSAERKASETADVLALRLGRQVAIDDDLRETDRPEVWDDDYRALVERYLGGEDLAGWEPRERVAERFSAAVERAIAASTGSDTIVVNHGQALGLFLASKVELDIVPFWRSLTFPDAWALDLETGELTHLFEAGLPPPDG